MFLIDSYLSGLVADAETAKTRLRNDLSIWRALFSGNLFVIFRRLVYETPQTVLGFFVANLANYRTKSPAFRENETLYVPTLLLGRSAVSLGSYIIGTEALTRQPMLRYHEFGHCLQSRLFGWLYLIVVGAPSLYSAILTPEIHNTRRCEYRANFRAKRWLLIRQPHLVWDEKNYPTRPRRYVFPP